MAGDPEAMTRETRLREGVPIPPSLAEQMSASDFAQYIERETVKWTRVVKEAGIKAE